jgi:hypothetical protein|tara:strand:+ start:966 stop:1490 length:525 start_codon:yes stop_codon:yes gene_type:complete
LEALVYLIIFFFYIVSGYREWQKKRKAKNEPISKPDIKEKSSESESPTSETQSVLDFLNNAFEEIEKQSHQREKSNVSSSQVFFDENVDLVSQDTSHHKVEPTFDEHFDADHDMSKVDERHLEDLSTKIKHKKTKYDQSSSQISKIKSIQKKYSKNPFQLAVVMQEILNKPKTI